MPLLLALGAALWSPLVDRLDNDKLSRAFTLLVLGVGSYTALQALPAWPHDA